MASIVPDKKDSKQKTKYRK
jgi:hypothetical protein